MTDTASLPFARVGIIGGGAWGTALAQSAIRAGRSVLLWAREPEVVTAINETHENKVFLPNIPLDPALRATTRLEDLGESDIWLLVAPAQHTQSVVESLARVDGGKKHPIVLCSKGIEQKTLRFPAAIVADLLPDYPLAVLSGPTFAAEVARGQPTAVTLACADEKMAQRLVETLGSRTFRPYSSTDIIGAEVGGAIKNVLAVACGIAKGCGMEDNARAALITRGLAEIMRLGKALGARTETMMGLSGLGDLTLTCSSLQSRNMSLGVALGRGEKLADILAARTSVAEGVSTASAAVALAQKYGVDMPITQAVDAILNHNADVAQTIASLLARPWRAEDL